MFRRILILWLLITVGQVFGETWYEVYATREGLVGGKTATGHIIREDDVFVALPDRSALRRWVEVEYLGRRVVAQVLDVGPWSIEDPYWLRDGVPLAERGLRRPIIWMEKYGKPKNKAGIDLSNGLWRELGIPWSKGIVKIKWRWVE